MTISFRLIAMFSSPLARRAFSSSRRSLFANLSFLVRSGPIYTSRVLSCRANALLRFSIILHIFLVRAFAFNLMGRLFVRSFDLPSRVVGGVCLNSSVISSVSIMCLISSRSFPFSGTPLTITSIRAVFFRSLSNNVANYRPAKNDRHHLSSYVMNTNPPCIAVSSSTGLQ